MPSISPACKFSHRAPFQPSPALNTIRMPRLSPSPFITNGSQSRTFSLFFLDLALLVLSLNRKSPAANAIDKHGAAVPMCPPAFAPKYRYRTRSSMPFMRIFSPKLLPIISFLLSLGASPSLLAQWVPLNPVGAIEPQPDGVVLVLKTGFLRFQVCSDSIVHVVYSLERSVAQHPDFKIGRA